MRISRFEALLIQVASLPLSRESTGALKADGHP